MAASSTATTARTVRETYADKSHSAQYVGHSDQPEQPCPDDRPDDQRNDSQPHGPGIVVTDFRASVSRAAPAPERQRQQPAGHDHDADRYSTPRVDTHLSHQPTTTTSSRITTSS